MKNIFLFISVALLSISCKESPEKQFKKDGISFTCPSGWKVTDQEKIDNQGYYLSIEKDGFNSSGLLTMTWLYNEIDLNDWMDIFKDELKNNSIYKNSSLQFGEQTEGSYHDKKTILLSFTATILNVKHEGEIHVFEDKGYSFGFIKQEAIEDKMKNKNGFDSIEQSFKIE